MVAIKGDGIGPLDASGTTTPFAGNALDTVRHGYYLAARGGGIGGKGGILEGLVPSIVAGQMQLSFTAGSAFAPERDASAIPLARGYDVWNDAASVVQFTAAHATLPRIDTVVAAAVDGEDGAVGTGALAYGYHLAVVPGTPNASPVTPTDANITTYLGRGGWDAAVRLHHPGRQHADQPRQLPVQRQPAQRVESHSRHPVYAHPHGVQ